MIHCNLLSGPWEKDPHYFKDIQISALALLKMVMHARSGGSLEIMGLLLGKVVENTMVRRPTTQNLGDSGRFHAIYVRFFCCCIDCNGCLRIAGGRYRNSCERPITGI